MKKETLAKWDFGYQSCSSILEKMELHVEQEVFTESVWMGEHPPIVTMGPRAPRTSIFNPSLNITTVKRGGMATLHMPGQLMFYPLIDLKKHTLNIRQWIDLLEQCVINTLKKYQIYALRCKGEPGVFAHQGKIASIGIKIKNHRSYYGLCLNVLCNLGLFQDIIPCGLQNRPVASIYSAKHFIPINAVKQQLFKEFTELLYNSDV